MMQKRDIVIPLLFFAFAFISYLFFDDVGPFAGNIFLDAVMQGITLLGEAYIYIALAVLFILVANARKNKKVRQQSAYFLLAFLFNSILVLVLKESIGRERPLQDAFDSKSFPSGHAAQGIFTAKVVGDWYPKFRSALYIFAVLAAFSRIYFGLHYLSDIFAGFGISYLTGTLSLWFYDAFILKTRQKSS